MELTVTIFCVLCAKGTITQNLPAQFYAISELILVIKVLIFALSLNCSTTGYVN